MRPPSGGYQDLSSRVLLPQTARHMAPLHSSSPLTPVSLAAQRFTLSLPLVQIQMPLISNEIQWQSRTLLSRERRNARRIHRNRGTNRTQQQITLPWQGSDSVFNTYMSDEQSSRQRVGTSTDVLNQSLVEIESHHSSIDLPSTEICRLTSDETQGTNLILTDSIDIEADQKCLKMYNFDSEVKNLMDAASESFCEADSDDDLSLPLNSFRMLSVRTMLKQPTTAAKRMASKIIRHARYNKVPNEQEMCCPDCGLIPVLPVTGQCGHTRCTKCIKDKGACSCGAAEPETLHVNTLVQDIIAKMFRHCPVSRRKSFLSAPLKWPREPKVPSSSLLPVTLQRASWCNSKRYRRIARSSSVYTGETNRHTLDITLSVPMSMQARYEMARKLISLERYREAAPYLAYVAASTEDTAKQARILLAQAITVMSGNKECRWLTRELYRGVRDHSAAAWLKASDLECILCCNTFTEPVTTPCGHTYCRTCIERSLDYRKKCALCLRPLDNFNLAMTRPTVFVSAALTSIDALSPPPPLEPDVIPIFVCTVAYPAIPCPLFIFDPRYWLMVRRVLESGSRKFGMVAYERDRTYSNYGTILKVCDCVHLEDGRSILSTVGVSRFRVIERHVRDGCDVARIEPLTDIAPTDPLITWELRVTAVQICYKALVWLNGMNKSIFAEIEATFGHMPQMNALDSNWWETPDGPAWMWWLVAILPLKSEIKVLILSTQNLLKRMTAIYRTLDVIDQITITTSTAEIDFRRALNTTEEWLQHGS